MSVEKIQSLVVLQQMKYDSSCQRLAVAKKRVAQFAEISEDLKVAASMPDLVADALNAQRHDHWRHLKLIENNLHLAAARADFENCRAECAQEFGRLQTLSAIAETGQPD